MNATAMSVLMSAVLCLGQVTAAEQKTVFAIAKVDGKTKRIDGHVYQLVAIRLDPSINLLGSGLTSPVLLVAGTDGKTAVVNRDKEWGLEDEIGRYRLFWLRLPDKGDLEVVWGALSDPKEGDLQLRERLIKAGYVPFKKDVRKLPALKASTAKELLAALDELAKPAQEM